MGFGVTGGDGTISKTQNATVNVAEKISDVGNIAEMTAYGGAIETTIETYQDAASWNNAATNNQAAGDTIITANSLVEANTEYCRESTTTKVALPATTTT